jgi:K+-transporting ATPase ATPase C chain
MKQIIIAFKLLVVMTVITGVIYPLVITGAAQVIFPSKSNGSFIKQKGKIIGSKLVGQQFSSPRYFWGRPSAINNKPMPTGGSNLSPVGQPLKEQVLARKDTISKYHGNLALNQIPKDLLFASASGVDPHISPEAAFFQIERIVKARNFDKPKSDKLRNLVNKYKEARQLGIFGEKRINVLLLNIELDKI